MYLDKLLLKDFGKFHNKEITLTPGLNLITGEEGSGKSTVGDFICASIYGISPSEEAGDRPDVLEERRPENGSGFSGKAYVQQGNDRVLVERSFVKKGRRMNVLDLATGRELIPAEQDTLYKTFTDMTKNAYRDTLMIPAEREDISAEALERYLINMGTMGTARFDREKAVAYLSGKRAEQDVAACDARIAELEEELVPYKGVEDELFEIRKQIDTVEEEFAIETARRKREARRLISTTNGEVHYEDNKALNEDLDALSDNRVFLNADILKDYKPPKETKDKLWFIALVGLFVIGVVALMVWMLPFDNVVRYIFLACTVVAVLVTILQGLYDKGELFSEGYMPSEEEFKRIIYDLERKNEVYEDVEIDMSFAKEFLSERERLHGIEEGLVKREQEKKKLTDTLRAERERRGRIDGEKTAINLAINTINELARERVKKDKYYINGRIADAIRTLTGGRYTDAQVGKNGRLIVRTDAGEVRYIGQVPQEDLFAVYLAVRLTVAKQFMRDRLPLIIDGLPFEDAASVMRLLQVLSELSSEQIIIMTRSERTREIFETENIGIHTVAL